MPTTTAAPIGRASNSFLRALPMAMARQSGCRAPIPHPENLEIRAEYRGGNRPIPETPPGVPTGFGLAASGGMLPKLASARGSGGRAAQLALTI